MTCAIAMQRGVARLDRANPLIGIGLRVGVAVGEAVQEEGDWYGTPVVEAARVCAAARAGQIVVADLVPALLGSRGGHRFTSLGSMALKGLDDVSACEVTWEPDAGRSALSLPATLDAAASAPMVDRWSERDTILAFARSGCLAPAGTFRCQVWSSTVAVGAFVRTDSMPFWGAGYVVQQTGRVLSSTSKAQLVEATCAHRLCSERDRACGVCFAS